VSDFSVDPAAVAPLTTLDPTGTAPPYQAASTTPFVLNSIYDVAPSFLGELSAWFTMNPFPIPLTQMSGYGWTVTRDFFNAPVTVATGATSEANATTILTSTAANFTSRLLNVDFFSPEIVRGTPSASAYALHLVLLRDTTVLGGIGQIFSAASQVVGVPVFCRYLDTPQEGSHSYTVKAWENNAGSPEWVVQAGPGGPGNQYVPGFIQTSYAG